MEENKTEILVSNQRLERIVLFVFIGFAILLVLLDAFLNYGRFFEIRALRRIFNIAREGSIPSWFSVLQFSLISLVSCLICLRRKAEGANFKIIFSWILVAFFFLFLSIDDASQIHERVGSAFKEYSKDEASFFAVYFRDLIQVFPSYVWQIVVAPIFICFGFFMFFFFLKEFKSKRSKIYVFLAFSLYALAILFDFVEGIKGGHSFIENGLGLSKYTVRHFSKSIEEFIEMCGSTLVLVSLLPLLSGLKLCFSCDEQTKKHSES